jgi:hypothetical protein
VEAGEALEAGEVECAAEGLLGSHKNFFPSDSLDREDHNLGRREDKRHIDRHHQGDLKADQCHVKHPGPTRVIEGMDLADGPGRGDLAVLLAGIHKVGVRLVLVEYKQLLVQYKFHQFFQLQQWQHVLPVVRDLQILGTSEVLNAQQIRKETNLSHLKRQARRGTGLQGQSREV